MEAGMGKRWVETEERRRDGGEMRKGDYREVEEEEGGVGWKERRGNGDGSRDGELGTRRGGEEGREGH